MIRQPSLIPLDQVHTVRLVTERDPAVIAFRARLYQQSAERTADKKRERAAERERLEVVLGQPIEQLLAHEQQLRQTMLEEFRRSQAGHAVPRPWTWERLSALEHRLRPHGIHYGVARWEAHRHDLAGTTMPTPGFQVGRQWEAAVRAGITARYGARFFLPQRWLVATARDGRRWFREADGIERQTGTTAIVYEIKHGEFRAAADVLHTQYVPLLARAFPHVTFATLEVNSANPYRQSVERRDYVLLSALEARAIVPLHQVWIPQRHDLPSLPGGHTEAEG